jgi:hypothetical protein
VPGALMGMVVGFFLAAQHLPLSGSLESGQCRQPTPAPGSPVAQTLTKTVAVETKQPGPAGKTQPKPQPAPALRKRPPQPITQKDPFDYNYALAIHGATVKGGVRPELLIDGKTSPYDGSLGFGYSTWNSKKPQSFVVMLEKPVMLNVVRFLLWDKSNRFYRYKLEASAETEELGGDHWFMLADRSMVPNECRGWQTIMFRPCTVARLRLTGTYNSANASFHVVEFEAYHIPGGLEFPWAEPEF